MWAQPVAQPIAVNNFSGKFRIDFLHGDVRTFCSVTQVWHEQQKCKYLVPDLKEWVKNMVAGKDSVVSFIEETDFLEGHLIYSDEHGGMKSWVSDGLKRLIEER